MSTSVELVVTAPKAITTALVSRYHCRTTAGVIGQIVVECRSSLILAAPFLTAGEDFFGSDALFTSLEKAVQRGVQTTLFLSKEGATSFRQTSLVQSPNVEVYIPSGSYPTSSLIGSHAKVIAADMERAYIGSANLTDAGLNSNLEMGLLIAGDAARQVSEVWYSLASTGFFNRVFG